MRIILASRLLLARRSSSMAQVLSRPAATARVPASVAKEMLLAAILRSRAAQSPQLVEDLVPASVADTTLVAAILPSAVEPSMLKAEIIVLALVADTTLVGAILPSAVEPSLLQADNMVLESEAVKEVQRVSLVVILSSAVEPSLLQAVIMRPVLAEVEVTITKTLAVAATSRLPLA